MLPRAVQTDSESVVVYQQRYDYELGTNDPVLTLARFLHIHIKFKTSLDVYDLTPAFTTSQFFWAEVNCVLNGGTLTPLAHQCS